MKILRPFLLTVAVTLSIMSRPSIFGISELARAQESRGHSNHLSGESSPYLLQHSHNPVDWYPWRDDAFARARKENKPIFLSIGYSACHWCHVMERESFENDEIARILNKDFISIKVDREERPDVDDLYMTAIQIINRSGGWPMSVWLTPDGKPFYGATYFPPDKFKQVVGAIETAWKTRRLEIDKSADSISDAVKRQVRMASASATLPARSLLSDALAELKSDYDQKNGGFGTAPKFPPHNTFPLLLYLHQHSTNGEALGLALGTLDGMARGGIRDHLGGGFHRYSTDAVWLVPHFEKMLYDNALLAEAYTDAYRITGSPLYKQVAKETLDWALREMRGPEGGFYSTLDADSEGNEGKYYLWTRSEIINILGKTDGEQFCDAYGVSVDGNFMEQSTSRKTGTNIFHFNKTVAGDNRMSGVYFLERTAEMRRKLLAARNKRVRPNLDDKRLTSWNGLMISALSRAGAAFHEPRYIQAASQSADFVLRPLLRGGRLLHSQRPSANAHRPTPNSPAFLEDYSYLLMGLLDLHNATHLQVRLGQAKAVADAMIRDMADPDGGSFDSTNDDAKLFARSKTGYDSATPSPNGIAARALIRLSGITAEGRFRDFAERTIKAFGGLVSRSPRAAQTLLLASAEFQDHGDKQRVDLREILPQKASKGPVALSAACDSVMPGRTVRFTIRVDIKPGWHINSVTPLDKSLIPTSIFFEPSAGFLVSKPVFPTPKLVKLGFSKDKLSVFENELVITAKLTIPRSAKLGSGARTIVRLRYQACNDKSCLAPENLAVSIPVAVIQR